MAPDGRQGHYIECPRSIDVCMDRAAELCPRGYDVIDSGGQHGAVAQTYHGPYASNTVVTPTFRGNMTIACRAQRPPEPPAPSAWINEIDGSQAPPPQAQCRPLAGIYTVHHVERQGTCGSLGEQIMNLDLAHNPSPCRQIWPDGCGMTIDCKFPATGATRAMAIVGMARWGDGSAAKGVEAWTIAADAGGGCSSTYDVTYERQ